jgi:hypothetical protein
MVSSWLFWQMETYCLAAMMENINIDSIWFASQAAEAQ